jgi:hypothetical protein
MSSKQQHKFRGIRRITRRSREWARWYRQGLFDLEVPRSARLRLLIGGPSPS